MSRREIEVVFHLSGATPEVDEQQPTKGCKRSSHKTALFSLRRKVQLCLYVHRRIMTQPAMLSPRHDSSL